MASCLTDPATSRRFSAALLKALAYLPIAISVTLLDGETITPIDGYLNGAMIYARLISGRPSAS